MQEQIEGLEGDLKRLEEEQLKGYGVGGIKKSGDDGWSVQVEGGSVENQNVGGAEWISGDDRLCLKLKEATWREGQMRDEIGALRAELTRLQEMPPWERCPAPGATWEGQKLSMEGLIANMKVELGISGNRLHDALKEVERANIEAAQRL